MIFFAFSFNEVMKNYTVSRYKILLIIIILYRLHKTFFFSLRRLFYNHMIKLSYYELQLMIIF